MAVRFRMNNTTYDRLPMQEKWMVLCFGSVSPPIAEFPHCIFVRSRRSLAVILELTDAKGGIWGDEPLVDRNGAPYIGPEDGRIIEDFPLWEMPENQELVLRSGWAGKIGTFTMVIDSRTPPEVLSGTYSESRDDEGDYPYYKYIERISRWITALRWAYIPLGDECDLALFVVSDSCKAWALEAETALRTGGEPVTRLRAGGGRYFLEWPPDGDRAEKGSKKTTM